MRPGRTAGRTRRWAQTRAEVARTLQLELAASRHVQLAVLPPPCPHRPTASSSKKATTKAPPKARSLREIKLETPIRYSAGDKVEKWLNSLLCLDASVLPKASHQGCPHPSECELFYVSRDTLFSYHPASEVFLQRMMALYVASHYKNQPNDLQLLSDAPAHHLFVLLPPIKDDESHLPEPLVVLQVALEGKISKDAIMEGLSRGYRAGGDMIPWLVSQQFQESKFALLSGARVVRIATHPDYTSVSLIPSNIPVFPLKRLADGVRSARHASIERVL